MWNIFGDVVYVKIKFDFWLMWESSRKWEDKVLMLSKNKRKKLVDITRFKNSNIGEMWELRYVMSF